MKVPDKKKKTSIYDIASKLGVSASTVSRALKDHRSIGEAMKAQIRKTAKEMNYKPNSVALNLKLGKSNAIGVVVPHVNRNFFSSAIEGIEYEAYKHGYDVLICQSNELMEKESKLVNSLSQGKVDGVIASLAAGTHTFDHFNMLEQYGIPLVLFDRVTDQIESALTITVDDKEAAAKVVRYLYKQGRRKIYHIAGPQHVSVWANRCEGYKQAICELGLEMTEEWIFYGSSVDREEGQEIARKIIAMKDRPDAIFFTSDFVALGAIMEFKKQGIVIPDEIAIVGFANEPFDELITPTLTSVEQFSYKMGTLAAQKLIEKIQGNHPSHIVLEAELIERESSGKK